MESNLYTYENEITSEKIWLENKKLDPIIRKEK